MGKMAAAAAMLAVGAEQAKGHPPPAREPGQSVCDLFRVVNGHPSENMRKVLELMGGVEKLVAKDDVVVIKPNVQWWNQGAPNLAALKAFVDAVMARPGGFRGEVVLAENCHRGHEPWKAAGWGQPFQWNADLPGVYNMKELSGHLKKRYGVRFSECHWLDLDAGGRRVHGPQEGTGYVYCDGTGRVPLLSVDNGVRRKGRRATIMTYPVFGTDRGTIIDFKNGVWERGACTNEPLFFVNFAALNHHSIYCGATSAVKNYMGISDLSGGPDPHKGGRLSKDFYNFHSFPFDEWGPGPTPGMLGAEIATFMNTVRRADLNITTAEWVGLSSRIEAPLVRTRAVLASTDPVALDYHGTKYLLHPNSRLSIHDPDDRGSPLHQYLAKCSELGGGVLNERLTAVKSWDFRTGRFQQEREFALVCKKYWGRGAKAILKYLYFKYFSG